MSVQEFVENVAGVDVVRWDPIRNDGATTSHVSNFGDLLGPLVVSRLLPAHFHTQKSTPKRLLTVGSILHMARDEDVIWGAGANGKLTHYIDSNTRELDVRAVRGPLTREILLGRGFLCAEVYGDPALLLPDLFPDLLEHPSFYRAELIHRRIISARDHRRRGFRGARQAYRFER